MAILSFTTKNNKWETITNIEVCKENILNAMWITQGELDYDPAYGTIIQKSMFKLKSDSVKNQIINNIKNVFNQEPTCKLLNLEANEMEKGWVFNCEVSYLKGLPETWSYKIEQNDKGLISSGYYPLGDN